MANLKQEERGNGKLRNDNVCICMYVHVYTCCICICSHNFLLSKTTFFAPCSAEDQVAEVYKEFEVAVQVDPERMKRRSQASSDNSSIASRELK